MNPFTGPNPPVTLAGAVHKVWLFTQNADGTMSPGSSGGGGGNVNITGINSIAPAFTNPLPIELSDGTQPVGTPSNPLSVNVISGGGSNASVGLTGSSAPTSATEIGAIDGSGNLRGASSSNPIPVGLISSSLPSSNMTGTTPGTAPANTSIVGGKYNLSAPTFADGQTGPLQFDVNGKLLVSAAITAGIANPLPISAASLPLPTGAATATKQDTGNTSLASIDSKLTNPLPISAASLPLPALAATSTKQSDGTQKTQVVDGSGNVISSTGNALDVNIKSGITNPLPISGTVGVSGTVATIDAADGTTGATSPVKAIQVGSTNPIGALTALQSDLNGNLMVGFNGAMLTVLQEILMETRALRKLMMMVYEESGEGNPAALLDDTLDSTVTDY